MRRDDPGKPIGVRAKKRLGQHFLHDKKIARRIADLLQSESGESVIEIGPGQGALTQYLLELDAPLTLVEYDAEAAAWLREHMLNGENTERAQLIEADVLRWQFPQDGPFCVISNLPYNISSPALFKLLENRERMRRAVLMLQKEVADRLAASPGGKVYGAPTVLLGYYYDVFRAFNVAPGAFAPPPAVQSSVIVLDRKAEWPETPYPELARLIKTAFGQRRKQLGNALKPLAPELPPKFAKLRAEQLSGADFIELAEWIRTQT